MTFPTASFYHLHLSTLDERAPFFSARDSATITLMPSRSPGPGKTIPASLALLSLLIACGKPPPVATPPPAAVPTLPRQSPYEYQLAPGTVSPSGGYSRMDLENFLFCAADGGFSVHQALNQDPRDQSTIGKSFVQVGISQKIRDHIMRREVSRWFENPVTVRLRGEVTPAIRRMTERFFSEVNRFSGTTRFLVLPGTEAAHIMIRVGLLKEPLDTRRYLQVGESSGLSDRMRVHLRPGAERLLVDTFTAEAVSQPLNARFIRFTPEDLEFLKRHRMVKVFIHRWSRPDIQENVLVHELLHAVGLPGHSPFTRCGLFPLANPRPGNTGGTMLSPLSATLVEMLYRREIGTGMSLEEAANILSSLPRLDDTGPELTRRVLRERMDHLEAARDRLLTVWLPRFRERIRMLVELDGLARRERDLFLEWRELFTDEGRNPRLIDLAMSASSPLAKRAIINFRLHRLDLRPGGKHTRRQRRLIAEERMILKDLLEAEKHASTYEARIRDSALRHPPGECPEEIRMRRMERQLMEIKKYFTQSRKHGEEHED